MHKMLALIVLLCGILPLPAQEPKPLADAGTVTCDDHDKKGPSDWVNSSAGNAAAVELAVTITGSGDARHCITDWNLHVRAKDGADRVLPIAQRDDVPEDAEWIKENSFWIDEWSKDGTMVLASQIEIQGDWDETTPVIYDFNTKKQYRIELYPLFKKLIPKSCYVVYRALRFTDDGQVLISAMSTDDDREPGTKACFPESSWKLDFRQKRISRVATNHRH